MVPVAMVIADFLYSLPTCRLSLSGCGLVHAQQGRCTGTRGDLRPQVLQARVTHSPNTTPNSLSVYVGIFVRGCRQVCLALTKPARKALPPHEEPGEARGTTRYPAVFRMLENEMSV